MENFLFDFPTNFCYLMDSTLGCTRQQKTCVQIIKRERERSLLFVKIIWHVGKTPQKNCKLHAVEMRTSVSVIIFGSLDGSRVRSSPLKMIQSNFFWHFQACKLISWKFNKLKLKVTKEINFWFVINFKNSAQNREFSFFYSSKW